MNDEDAAAGPRHGSDEVADEGVALVLVDADAVLDRHRHVRHIDHGLDAVGHQVRLGHQAGAEGAALHPLAGAAAVQVDLVVAPLLAQLRAMRQVVRLAAAQLQGNRMLVLAEVEVARHVAMQQRARGHHLGVQQGVVAEQAVEMAAVAVGPVHHGGHRHAPPLFGRESSHGRHRTGRRAGAFLQGQASPDDSGAAMVGLECGERMRSPTP